MRAMVFEGKTPRLCLSQVPVPVAGAGQVLIRIEACGVCRTDLHVVDGELRHPTLPLIPGHEIVGRVEKLGDAVSGLHCDQRVGVPWLGHTCGHCAYCTIDRENLCDNPGFTGYTINGGYAEFCAADTRYVFPLREDIEAASLAPLLCAGLIGHRCLRLAGDVSRLGLYGFGAAAHILCQVARYRQIDVYAFTRDGDELAQAFARSHGACWAGGASETAPVLFDAAIIFAPVGELVPLALRSVRKGGRVVCGGIHMSDIPGFPYADLWEERSILSVANLTRSDGDAFFPLAEAAQVRTQVVTYPLEAANTALDHLRAGKLQGAAVLLP